MMVLGMLALLIFITSFIALDLAKKIRLVRPVFMSFYLLLALNLVLVAYWAYEIGLAHFSPGWRLSYLLVIGIGLLYLWIRLNVSPSYHVEKMSARLEIMMAGRTITYYGLWAMVLELISLILIYRYAAFEFMSWQLFTANALWGWGCTLSLLVNGSLRMFFTSRRLSVLWRAAMLLSMWIPLVNLIVLAHASRLVHEEYDFACYKENIRSIRAESDLCQTRYPLVMVHGILFRDLKYFNYWGRIPKELIRYGATVYYGNQEAVGTIAYNAEDIKRTIEKVMAETGCEKVNIIAHSKGGLDARYAITKLGMGAHVASLTTMNTPHHGCTYVDKAYKLPEGIYRGIARLFDNTFRRIGDKNPDFYNATRQFSTHSSREFNNQVSDVAGVYYQSYMTKMTNFFSDPLLCIPYAIIRSLEGENDGLVSVNSAKWGDFRELICAPGRRGISHGDIIDLKREDIKGFDVVECYIKIVTELKQRGF